MFKRSIAILAAAALMVMLAIGVLAQTTREEFNTVSQYLDLVDQKLANRRKAGNTAAVSTLQKEKEKTIKRLKELKQKLAQEKKAAPSPPEALSGSTEVIVEEVETPSGEVVTATVVENPLLARFSNFKPQLGPFKIGGVIGLTAGMPGGSLQFWFPVPLKVMNINMEGRWALGYAQGEDADGFERRCVPLELSGITYLPTDWTAGAQSYIGGSLNYLVLTSGMKSGGYGGALFYGLQSDSWIGKLFVELGYGGVRTGFSPSLKGGQILIGFRYFEK